MQKTKKKFLIVLGIFTIIIILSNLFAFLMYDFDSQMKLMILIVDLLLIIFSFLLLEAYLFKNKKKEVLLLLFVLLFIFILIEIILRISSCTAFFERFPEEIRYKHYPYDNFCNKIKDGEYFRRTTNNEGFIDSDFNSSNEFNIFLLGDSFAGCNQAQYSNCAHQKLEKDLQGVYNKTIDVMNFGIGGYGALDHLANLKKYKEEYNPQLAIVYFLAQNDLKDNEFFLNYEYNPNYKLKRFLKRLSPKSIAFFVNGLNNIFLSNIERAYNYQSIENYEVYLNNYSPYWENLMNLELETLLEIKKVCDEENIPLLVVLTTSTEQVYEEDWKRVLETYPSLQGKEYNLSKPNTIVENFLNEQNIYNLNLLPLFKQNPERLHWPKDGHWNDAGQLFAAEKIKEFIRENNLL